ncbi:MAG: sulfotransferase [Ilumatobacter sp.]
MGLLGDRPDRASRLVVPGASLTPRPILVTGMPRSGTTWVAQQLASCPGTAMAGREPMNARDGQYALGGTLDGWARLEQPTDRQAALLKRAYAGRNLMTFSRYGVRQWAAPLRNTRVIVKDPFAVLSLPAIVELTRAVPVVVYRHPGAVLASFRRMGWSPDPAELRQLEGLAPGPDLDEPSSDLELVARMWSVLYRLVLADLTAQPTIEATVVSHEELAGGGERALDRLRVACGLDPLRRSDPAAADVVDVDENKLHNLDRDPRTVAAAWRSQLQPGEDTAIEQHTGDVLAVLRERSLRLAG